jgi:hypothetical protein
MLGMKHTCGQVNVDRILIINLEGNRLFGSHRLRYEDIINMGLDVPEHEHDTYSVACRPQANYTDRAAAAC